MQQRLNLGWQKNLKHVPSSRVVTKTRNDLKRPKTTQNDPKWPKMTLSEFLNYQKYLIWP